MVAIFGLVALGLHLVVGFMILISGLIAPVPVVVALIVVWVVGVVVGVRWWRRHPGRTQLVPLVAFAVWALTVLIGGALFGWTT